MESANPLSSCEIEEILRGKCLGCAGETEIVQPDRGRPYLILVCCPGRNCGHWRVVDTDEGRSELVALTATARPPDPPA